jgi:HlyD family secretion protein
VTQADGQTGVYVAGTEGKAQFKAIKLGTTTGDRVQILEGLTKGDRVFTTPPANVIIEGVDTVDFE